MKSWAFLKESMEKLSSEVQQIMLVRKDISMIQQDLSSQTELWHQAELELGQANNVLNAKIETLHAQVQAGAQVRSEVTALMGKIQDEQLAAGDLQQASQHDQQQWAVESAVLAQRQQALEGQLQGVKAATETEVGQAHQQQLQLQSDAEALRLKEEQLLEQTRTLPQALELQRQTAEAKTNTLQRQLQDMRQGLILMQKQLVPPVEIERDLHEVRSRLRHEMQAAVRAKEAQVNVATECNNKRKRVHDVLCSEQGKAKTRNNEAVQLCQPVRGQHAVLTRMLDECNAADK